MREVIPTVARRFEIDPHRVAIGGISMGGFGAYDLALLHPRRFCAVGGHSPALWFEGGETAPGAFENAADFDRNDVVRMVRGNPDAFAGMRVWNDYGDEDPFHGYDEGFVEYLRADGADLSAHSWPGDHDNGYWNATGPPTCASTPMPWRIAENALPSSPPLKTHLPPLCEQNCVLSGMGRSAAG